MPDDKKPVKTGESELLKRLEQLEADIHEVEKARHQQTVIARVGLLLIILAIAFFAFQLWKFSKVVTSDEYVADLSGSIEKHMMDMMANDDNLKKLRTDITERIIPEVSKQVMERMQKELPIFKEKGEKILANIKTHLENNIQVKLTAELESAIKDVEAEILKNYPDISPEKLDAVFKKTESVFIENITDMLEKKVELVYEDLDEMEKTINKFSKIAEEAKLGEKEMEMVKLDFVENLLEIAIYHVNPDKGELPAEFVQRTEKNKPAPKPVKAAPAPSAPVNPPAPAPVKTKIEGGVK